MSPERMEPIAVALVDPRRKLRAYADHLEARRVRVVAVVSEARVLRRLPADCGLDAVAIGGSGRNVPAAIAAWASSTATRRSSCAATPPPATSC